MIINGEITAFYGTQPYPDITVLADLWRKDAPDGLIYYSHDYSCWYKWCTHLPSILPRDELPSEIKLWAILLNLTK